MTDLSDRLELLGDQHRRALEWFLDRQGEVIEWPMPMDGLFLVNKAKGIHKPRGWMHALSVRQSLDGPYNDRSLEVQSDGTWQYEYYQEGHDPAKRDEDFTNRALMKNAQDGVPVGIMLQVKRKPAPRYKVAGLALVEGWAGGYFRLRGFAPDGTIGGTAPATATDEIVAAVSTAPIDLTDARRRINAAIVARQGAGKFRANALLAFENMCAITRCAVPEVLEAAHIVPYMGPATDLVTNTLLLRADLHTLFDRDLLAVDPVTLEVRLAPALLGSAYGELEGAKVHLPPGDPAPWRVTLAQRDQPLLAGADRS